MSEPFAKPLSVVIDYTGNEPQVVIDGTNYARNIARDSVVVQSLTPNPMENTAKVTVTFMVDDLRVVSGDAEAGAA